jgi:4-alpha-glucanotransferase
VITPAVDRLRAELGFPGMAVLQFGFDPEDPESTHDLANHAPDRVAYTGTHDNDTLAGWYAGLDAVTRARVDEVMGGIGERAVHWKLIELLWSSAATIAMTQVQDVLGLGNEARMNVPGTTGRSWRWRLEPGQLTLSDARRLREVSERAGRLPR